VSRRPPCEDCERRRPWCEGCDERPAVTVCLCCDAALCEPCFGPFTGGVCEPCLGGYQPELSQLGPVIEDVRVNRAVL